MCEAICDKPKSDLAYISLEGVSRRDLLCGLSWAAGAADFIMRECRPCDRYEEYTDVMNYLRLINRISVRLEFGNGMD